MKDIPILPPAEADFDQIRRLNQRMHQCGHYLYHHAASPRQRAVLQLLQEHGPMDQRSIQEALLIQPGSASELLSKLESKGFLQRQRSQTDKRKMIISLTESGRSLPPQPPEVTLPGRYAALTTEEQAQLTALLERLLDSWGVGGCCG